MLLIKHDGNMSELEGKHIIKMIPFLEIVEDVLNPSVSTVKHVGNERSRETRKVVSIGRWSF